MIVEGSSPRVSRYVYAGYYYVYECRMVESSRGGEGEVEVGRLRLQTSWHETGMNVGRRGTRGII